MTTNLLAQIKANNHKVILATPEYFQAFKENFDRKIKMDMNDFAAMFNSVPYLVNNGVAVLSFAGFVVNTADPIEEMFYGLVSLQNFCSDLEQAVNDESVTSVVINFDSGGGFGQYLQETSELIQELKELKPIIAYCSGYMCSAAYWVASNCSSIVCAPSAVIGSIGVRCEYLTMIGDSTTADGITTSTFKDAGFIVTTFQSGTEKTVGSEFIPLTADQKADIQSDIDEMGADFRALVVANRGGVSQAFMEGQTFTGTQAMEQNTNLADGLCNSLSQIVGLIQNQ